MTDKILIYISESTDPYRNLAAEEYLTKNARAGETVLFLWRNKSTVVIGKNQNSRAECDLDRMQKDGVSLARRLSGGGAVYHDEGNLCFSFISHEDEHNVSGNLSLIAAACTEFSIDAKPTGRNDITANGRKFSGNAFYSIGKNKCHHGTVLVSADTDSLARYLAVPPSKLEAKGIKSVSSRVVNLAEFNKNVTPETFADALIRVCRGEIREMPGESLYRARADFFASPEWLYGEDPEFTDEVKYRTADGEFTLLLNVKHGIVSDCMVYTDSLDISAAEKIRAEVIGKRAEDLQTEKLIN